MIRATAGGIAYFVTIIAAAMLLGSVRIVAMDPQLGAIVTLLIELPLIVGAAWLASGWIARGLAIKPRTAERLAMGGTTFLLLMAAGLGITLFVVGGSVAQHFGAYRSGGAATVLAGQLLIASFPLLRLGRERKSAAGKGAHPSLQAAIGEKGR